MESMKKIQQAWLVFITFELVLCTNNTISDAKLVLNTVLFKLIDAIQTANNEKKHAFCWVS